VSFDARFLRVTLTARHWQHACRLILWGICSLRFFKGLHRHLSTDERRDRERRCQAWGFNAEEVDETRHTVIAAALNYEVGIASTWLRDFWPDARIARKERTIVQGWPVKAHGIV
jgi:hypothetical protein